MNSLLAYWDYFILLQLEGFIPSKVIYYHNLNRKNTFYCYESTNPLQK